MTKLIYYMDETGNRHPDKKSTQERHGRDWFGLGGYLLLEEDKSTVRALHAQFCNEWKIEHPFHITDMLARRKKFAWLGRLSEREQSRFWDEYKDMISSIPALGTGCIISRPGYVSRGYVSNFPNSKWLLCRSAFDITIERSAKYAQSIGAKLDVVFEADGPLNETMKGYFKNLKENGLAFDAANAAKYHPFTQQDFSNTLGTIEYKAKASPYLQFADSYIYAIARQKYDRHFGVYGRLRDRKRIINFALQDADKIKAMGIKYYCFD
jgi:Protein of unknown function (DUF3800)